MTHFTVQAQVLLESRSELGIGTCEQSFSFVERMSMNEIVLRW
jgi:hypothetical protein